jgi:dolichol-phosphate mannosyltransferase
MVPRGTSVQTEARRIEVAAAVARTPELAVVVPTFNERDNVEPLLELLGSVLEDVDWEVIFVDDDSADGTAARVREIALHDPRVRCLQRIGRRGLSTACIEGVLASSAPYVAIMDGDLQHDERLLPRMLDTLKSEPIVDAVVGSRYVEHGSIGTWNLRRAWLSSLATRIARSTIRVPIADPMSGFFMLRREAFQGSMRRLSSIGFKIFARYFCLIASAAAGKGDSLSLSRADLCS